MRRVIDGGPMPKSEANRLISQQNFGLNLSSPFPILVSTTARAANLRVR
jgi:hypothetical protein